MTALHAAFINTYADTVTGIAATGTAVVGIVHFIHKSYEDGLRNRDIASIVALVGVLAGGIFLLVHS